MTQSKHRTWVGGYPFNAKENDRPSPRCRRSSGHSSPDMLLELQGYGPCSPFLWCTDSALTLELVAHVAFSGRKLTASFLEIPEEKEHHLRWLFRSFASFPNLNYRIHKVSSRSQNIQKSEKQARHRPGGVPFYPCVPNFGRLSRLE